MAENLLDDIASEQQTFSRRRVLIPTWIKIFIWIFLILGAFSIPVFIFGLLGGNTNLQLYGYSASDSLSAIGIALFLLFLLKGIVAYALWFEKDWAINLGLIDAAIGIVICITSMFGISFMPGHPGSFNFKLEIVFLVPYLIKLSRMDAQWRRARSGRIGASS
jgi:hypothetical protein